MSKLKRTLKLKLISKYIKPIYKNWWLYPLVLLLLLFFIFGVPLIINELYKNNSGYITLWEAKDVLSYYGIILSGVITLAALAVTLKHNRNMIENQMILNRAQVKQPFFICNNISYYPKNNFVKVGNYWEGDFYLLDIIRDNETDISPIIISLTNIGDGPALSIDYTIEMYNNTTYDNYSFLVMPDSSFEIEYKFQDNLKALHRKIESLYKLEDNDFEVKDYFTYIAISYQNMLGVKFCQLIEICISPEKEQYKIKLLISDISSQKIDN